MFNWIHKKLGHVRCRECNKWTEPSIIEGDICSVLCLCEEIEKNV